MEQFEYLPSATAETTFIRIVDTPGSDLDGSTSAIGSMNHSEECMYDFDLYKGLQTLVCESIMLPPNAIPPKGEGYSTCPVSPKNNLPNGTEIANSAWISFDYNPWLQAPEDGPVIRTIVQANTCGDAESSLEVNIGDTVFLINYIFKGGAAPDPLCVRDADGDDAINVGDADYLINYIFKRGPAPVEPCRP